MKMMLDTRAVSTTVRPDYWSAGIAQHFFPVEIESDVDAPFEARLSGGQIGPLLVRTISGHPHRVTRSRQMVGELDPDCILMYVARHGVCRVGQGSRECELLPGEVAVQDTSSPSLFEAVTEFEVFVAAFPKWFIGSNASKYVTRAGERLATPGDTLMRLSTSLLGGIGTFAENLEPFDATSEAAAEMMLALLRGLFIDPDAASEAQLRAMSLETRMRQYALAHLSDPDLGPEKIARAHFVSTRYVHKLFAPLGGVSGWVRSQRIMNAERDIRETGVTVSEVASRYGYRNSASFTRAFRREIGASPRELRSMSPMLSGSAVVLPAPQTH